MMSCATSGANGVISSHCLTLHMYSCARRAQAYVGAFLRKVPLPHSGGLGAALLFPDDLLPAAPTAGDDAGPDGAAARAAAAGGASSADGAGASHAEGDDPADALHAVGTFAQVGQRR